MNQSFKAAFALSVLRVDVVVNMPHGIGRSFSFVKLAVYASVVTRCNSLFLLSLNTNS